MSATEFPRVVLNDDLRGQFAAVSTASIASQLQMRGMQNCFLNGLQPVNDGQRMIGVARTLRYLPPRPDLPPLMEGDIQRMTVESIQEREVLVIDARGVPDAGTVGDIYISRIKKLGGAGLVTDGALRDTPAIREIGLPVYHQSSNAATLGRRHMSMDSQIPISCGGVTVVPGDIIVGDSEGAVVIPATWAHEIAAASLAMETEEAFVVERVNQGASTVDYFPLGEEQRKEYEAWLEQRDKE